MHELIQGKLNDKELATLKEDLLNKWLIWLNKEQVILIKESKEDFWEISDMANELLDDWDSHLSRCDFRKKLWQEQVLEIIKNSD